MEFVTLVMWAPQPISIRFMQKDNSSQYDALSVFYNIYVPATKENMTDMFSTLEIQTLVKDHVGINLYESEICDLMTRMNYTYQLEEDKFMWLCRKEK